MECEIPKKVEEDAVGHSLVIASLKWGTFTLSNRKGHKPWLQCRKEQSIDVH